MSSPCPEAARPRRSRAASTLALFAAVLASPAAAAAEPSLRVCAEPQNMPMSRRDEAGFENAIARLLATELQRELVYAWQPQRRGFVRKTVGADLCDVWVGVPAGFDRLLTTRPYYRSSYVFVARRDDVAPLRSLADPRLASLVIGIQLIGDDLAASPAALALARAGASEHVVGYAVYGEGSAAERISADLAAGRLDAALVWGPQAGYFADHGSAPLALSAVPAPPGFELPFAFAIAVGVSKSQPALRDDLDHALERRAREIGRILDDYGVPRLAPALPEAEAIAAGPARSQR